MHPYRTAPIVNHSEVFNSPNPDIDQRWKDSDGREFIVNDYIINSMTHWECYYSDISSGRIWFKKDNFNGCIFIGVIEK